ncbi:MAG: PilT/PilU family type 4a pilus ATPase [Polyangiaceae bacterium]
MESAHTPAIDAFFEALLSMKGSDLHVSVGKAPSVRQRGQLRGLRDRVMTQKEAEEVLLEILTAEQQRELDAELDLDFAYSFRDRASPSGEPRARFRASYFYKKSQDPSVARDIGAVFRVIPAGAPTLEELACPPAIKKLAESRAGLVLVTGPTGSGKSTTLAAMIRHINETRACHILTIEDPVEFVHAPHRAEITQREVGKHAPDFATAIRSAGRENADVILIGELRTNETMKLALQLASFGVLVFGTVHTNSAPATIDRILNAFPADEQPMVRGLLASGLTGIVAQQLVPTRDGHGRAAAHEILLGNSALSAMIRESKTFQIPSLMQAGQNVGMQTLDMALTRMVADGRVTKEAALEKASDKETFVRVVSSL